MEFYYVAPGFAGGDEDIAALRLEELARLSQPWAQLTRASRAMTAESFKESEALFEEAIAGIPNRAFPQMMLANLYMKQEQYDKALEALERYKEREHTWNDPGPAQTGLMTARIYQGLEKPTQAIEAIELALSENPNDMIRSQAEELLKDLK